MPVPDRRSALAAAYASLQSGAFAAARGHAAGYATEADWEARLLLGLALAGEGEAEAAARLLGAVARARPEAAHPASDLVVLLDRAKRHAAIEAYFTAALAQTADDHRLLTDAASWAQQSGRAEVAGALLARVRADYAPAAIVRAAAMADGGDFAGGIASLRGLIARKPSAAAHANLAVMLATMGDFTAADEQFRAARRLDPRHPQIAYNHGMALLKSGRLRQGWPAFNVRLALPGHSVLPFARLLPPLAEGQRLQGRTVLVTHDAGFGDTLQFCRFIPVLAARGARVLLWVPRTLERLMAKLDGVDRVFCDETAWPPYDWHCPVMRLAEVFGTTLETIPGRIPYLQADAGDVAVWAGRLPARDGRARIGLVWAGSAREGNPQLQAVDRRRSIDPVALGPLVGLDVQFVSLQRGGPPAPFSLIDPMDQVRDFADTAAIIANLDGVISVDTAVAHLAGALGKEVFLLDRFDNCWRWLTRRADSPWYPTLRIFRQQAWGDWIAQVKGLRQQLAVWVAQRQ